MRRSEIPMSSRWVTGVQKLESLRDLPCPGQILGCWRQYLVRRQASIRAILHQGHGNSPATRDPHEFHNSRALLREAGQGRQQHRHRRVALWRGHSWRQSPGDAGHLAGKGLPGSPGRLFICRLGRVQRRRHYLAKCDIEGESVPGADSLDFVQSPNTFQRLLLNRVHAEQRADRKWLSLGDIKSAYEELEGLRVLHDCTGSRVALHDDQERPANGCNDARIVVSPERC
mmetsp:Transcript_13339/g.29664  ORF Transcript_13339/g.29664 Transcript_13339/m.29664 type:complete len:229 (-) Transcript_13339:1033-1719(-)